MLRRPRVDPIRVRDGSLTAMGFRRPVSWPPISGIALLAAAAVRIALGQFVIDPLTAQFWPAAVAPEGTDAIRGNIPYALLALLVVWGFAAFGEEIGYRGYLLTRAADLGGRTSAAYWAGVVVVAVLFGVGHAFKGPAGIVDSGIAGLILGCASSCANMCQAGTSGRASSLTDSSTRLASRPSISAGMRDRTARALDDHRHFDVTGPLRSTL